jgi:hypothetical protein
MGFKKFASLIWIAGGLVLPGTAGGQSFDYDLFNPLSSKQAGVHLYGASVSTSYFSNAYGLGLTGQNPATVSSNAAIVSGSAVFGWSRQLPSSNISVTYAPTFLQSALLSGYRSTDHSLSASANTAFKKKWTLAAAVRGVVMDFNQTLNTQPQFGTISAAPATFDEFFGAMTAGRSDNTYLARALAVSPVADSPETAYLYGGRELSASGTVSVGYEQSTRSSYRLSADVMRTQFLPQDGSNGLDGAFLLPKTTTAGLGAVWIYSLSPRTTASFDVSSTRALSIYEDQFVNHFNVSIGHTMSRHWFLQGMMGMGVTSPLRQAVDTGGFAQQEYGGSVGYKLYAHTFVGTYSRMVSDVYGLGANATETSGGAWTWKRPGRSISGSTTFAYSHLIGPNFPNEGSMSFTTGVAKALDDHTVLSVSYRFLQYPQQMFTAAPNRRMSGVTLALSWSPSARR